VSAADIKGALQVAAGAERLLLLPQLAAFWPRMQTLLVADAHLGKAAAFRKAGIAVPSGTTEANLQALTALIDAVHARRVVFLGDLIHSTAARKAAGAAFIRWREQHADVDLVLVRGNHDRNAGDPPCGWGVMCVDEPYVVDSLALTHFPQAVPGCYALAGHLHPAANLIGRGRESMRLPCFYFTREYAILPAFGAFTGTADVAPTRNDRVYVVADGEVLEATGATRR
jgi:DNA ligase-associated metallophosphoesterase